MPPVLRPRTPKKGDAPRVKTPGSARPVRREFRNGARAGTGAEDQKWSFALSSSGWLFVYYVGVVKALAERGYHRYAPRSVLTPRHSIDKNARAPSPGVSESTQPRPASPQSLPGGPIMRPQ